LELGLPAERKPALDEPWCSPERQVWGRQELSVVETSRSSSDGRRRAGTAQATAVAALELEPFAVEVRRRDGLATVEPHGELDIATIETLRSALDGIQRAGRLVLDLRGLSFIDSTGLHLLIALHQRAQRDGFQLTLVAPAAPVDRVIQISGLDEALPFVPADDAVDPHPRESAAGPCGGRR
jgi:anti-sigma B factor antagonist